MTEYNGASLREPLADGKIKPGLNTDINQTPPEGTESGGRGSLTVRPIIFSGPMVQALLSGRKTQTRRLASSPLAKCKPGDVLYVRETWKPHSTFAGMKPRDIPQTKVFFAADNAYAPSNTPWVPCIHMPRWASRLTLTVVQVAIQRLQDMSEVSARREGLQVKDEAFMPSYRGSDSLPWRPEFPRDAFADLWDSLHGPPHSWSDNPEVVAIAFKVERRNVDQPTSTEATPAGNPMPGRSPNPTLPE